MLLIRRVGVLLLAAAWDYVVIALSPNASSEVTHRSLQSRGFQRHAWLASPTAQDWVTLRLSAQISGKPYLL